jgi:hypothetical protein
MEEIYKNMDNIINKIKYNNFIYELEKILIENEIDLCNDKTQ